MKKRWLKSLTYTALGVGLVMTTVLTAGCDTATVSSGDKVKVYTTMMAESDFVKQIGKEHVVVDTWVPNGVNVWQWAPTLADQKNLESANLFIRNGVNVEDRYWNDVETNMKEKNKGLLIVDASKGIDKLDLLEFINPDVTDEERNKPRKDPYYYLDPVNAKKEVDTIEAALEKKAPSYKEDFKKNAEEYKKRLDELDKQYRDTLSKVKHKEIVSPYPAYQYLAKEYGLKYYVPDTFTAMKFPQDDEAKGNAIKDDLAKHDIKAVFFQQEAAPRVQEFMGWMGYKSGILESYEGKQDKTYIETMQDNLNQLEAGLNLE
ncbi:metal ABC transporter substrate-binding protein [Tumebacillus flagellatus]|uniref:ABC transporter substrate-binding protein n=1 Tax=Tumebacillus flagellatus TaxID=1157490 RepID=A0A074M6M6_9BACL|nr:zinc ABC transporter substrate-binding protein [Tumebacillus flagellatus]KEO81617.1 hypothetical protein EL26_19775 [Tumebacillus flagellatus]